MSGYSGLAHRVEVAGARALGELVKPAECHGQSVDKRPAAPLRVQPQNLVLTVQLCVPRLQTIPRSAYQILHFHGIR